MKVTVREAWRLVPQWFPGPAPHTVVLIGTFRPHVIGPYDHRVAVPEPIRAMLYSPAEAVEAIRTHPFPIIDIRGPGLSPHRALRVELGDPVEWLPDWTWRDPMWRAVWRGEQPDPYAPHLVPLERMMPR